MDLDGRACHLTASFGGETAAQTARCRAPAAVLGAPVQKGFSAMNFRILAASVWPRGRVFAVLAAAALTASLPAPIVHAQQPTPAPAPGAPKAKAAPKAAPKAPPAPAPAPAAQAPP